MKRADILATASEYVTTDRAATHGNAEDNFLRTAELWNAYLGVDNISVDRRGRHAGPAEGGQDQIKTPTTCRQLDRHRRLCRLRWRDSDRRLKNDRGAEDRQKILR
jgi:hypothetical protein